MGELSSSLPKFLLALNDCLRTFFLVSLVSVKRVSSLLEPDCLSCSELVGNFYLVGLEVFFTALEKINQDLNSV